MRALVTSGGTFEAIDEVRFITNFSTGKTGVRIAEALIDAGVKVTLLKGLYAEASVHPDCHTENFTSFSNLDQKLKTILKRSSFDLIIHLAAVSDYSVSKVIQGKKELSPHQILRIGKLSADDSPGNAAGNSTGSSMTIELKKNFKIIDRIKSYTKKPIFLVGFKLTCSDSQIVQKKAVNTLSDHSGADLVVHNDLRAIRKSGRHSFRIFKSKKPLQSVDSTSDLVQVILNQYAVKR